MIVRLLRATLCFAIVLLYGPALVHADNLAVNGSFETGDFAGWVISGDTSLVGVCDVSTCPQGFAPQDGTFAAFFGPVGDTATLSQEIATNPGDFLQLKFYLADPEGGTPNYFSVTFGSTTLTLSNFGAVFGWQQFEIDTVATADQTLLSFSFRHDPAYWFLDNVQVTNGSCCGATPEPGTLLQLLSGGALAAAALRRWRR